jgi:hypothetical protein
MIHRSVAPKHVVSSQLMAGKMQPSHIGKPSKPRKTWSPPNKSNAKNKSSSRKSIYRGIGPRSNFAAKAFPSFDEECP